MAKPYSSSHIGFVSSGFTEMRLSGAVKEQLVEMLVAEIDRMVPAMESATLSANPDKKTLDDTNRTRLNYNVLEGQVSGSALTPMALRKMARSFAGMPITDAAVEELLLWYYEVVDETGQSIREHAQLGGNPAVFIESLDRMKDLMMLGWMRRMLVRAGKDAEERGYKRIDVEQLIHLDAFE